MGTGSQLGGRAPSVFELELLRQQERKRSKDYKSNYSDYKNTAHRLRQESYFEFKASIDSFKK